MKLNIKTIKWDKVFIKNFFSLAAVQGVNYVLPLLTLPYLVRVLGVENFGIKVIIKHNIAKDTNIKTIFKVITLL